MFLFAKLALCLMKSFVPPDNRKCKELGAGIFNLHIHVEPKALLKLRTDLSREFSSDFNVMAAAMKFFGGITDMINQDLEPYAVQLRNDLTTLRMTEMPAEIMPNKCATDFSISSQTQATSRSFALHGIIGHHLMLYYCKDETDGKKFHIDHQLPCSSVTGFFMGDLRVLAQTIRLAIIRAISRNKYEVDGQVNSNFQKDLCQQANRCLSIKRTEIGHYVANVHRVRHLADENYISGFGYQMRQHDLYDDVDRHEESTNEPKMYATEDYSNDFELYDDFHKSTDTDLT